MREFTDMFFRLDQSNKTLDKIEALKEFFLKAADEDKMWALAIFTHRRPKRQVNSRLLREWTGKWADIPDWLFEESYQTVGDLAETISLLLPFPSGEQDKPLSYWISFLGQMESMEEEEKKEHLKFAYQSTSKEERFILTKIITGGFRIGVSQNLVTQAVAEAFGLEKTEVAHRIMGDWKPMETTFENLILSKNPTDDLSRPYPFFLAHPLEKAVEELGEIQDWQVEWKWDGIRGQLIKRNQEIFIWSRGEELVSEKFPELLEAAKSLPDGTVLDGEILAFDEGMPLPFSVLQTRIGRKNLSKKILHSAPVSFMAYDLIEWKGKDIRGDKLKERRKLLEDLFEEISSSAFLTSPIVEASSWSELSKERENSRAKMAEGFMLKQKESAYEVGRKRGAWWKWKIEPLTIDGVLVYAQKGHGRRADLYTDYSFAVWEGDKLVPFAKAYSGLTDAEIREVDQIVKKNTLERFGPVRTVTPILVFEIAFEGIQKSPRHKSGISVRFPRIHRWRKDKSIEEANTLDDLKALLNLYGNKA